MTTSDNEFDPDYLDKIHRLRKLQMQVEMRGDPAQLKYRGDPVQWAKDIPDVFLWSKQKEVCQSVVENRYTAVPSAHGVGKSFTASLVSCWWLSVHTPGTAFLVSSAPTFSQVRNILWREIRKLHSKAKLPGRVNQTEWLIGDTIVGAGRKPQDTNEDAFQGIHEDYVLIILDEACGVMPQIWEAAETLMTNKNARILAIGNPDRTNSRFYDVCKSEPNWNVIKISAFDLPVFTGEQIPPDLELKLTGEDWVNERRQKWIEGSRLWQAKVLGEFPEDTEDGVIPLDWIRQCQDAESSGLSATENLTTFSLSGQDSQDMLKALRETKNDPWLKSRGVVARDDPDGTPNMSAMPGNAKRKNKIIKDLTVKVGGSMDRVAEYDEIMLPVELGLDVGGGSDSTVIWERRGKVACRVWQTSTQESSSVVNLALSAISVTGATSIKIDATGMGWGVCGHLESLYDQGKHSCKVVPVQVAQKPRNHDRFDRLRDELWWSIGREYSENMLWDLTQVDEDVVAELIAPSYEIDRYGRLKVESKIELRKRIKRSTDNADALLLAYYNPIPGKRRAIATAPISVKRDNQWTIT